MGAARALVMKIGHALLGVVVILSVEGMMVGLLHLHQLVIQVRQRLLRHILSVGVVPVVLHIHQAMQRL